jgi:3-methyl-2-oxobutanoate hydroxymethyltransferase
VKAYAELNKTVVDAVSRFRDEVRGGEFPAAEHTFE